MKTAAVRCIGRVIKADLRTGTTLGGVIVCTTDKTANHICYLTPELFRLLAENLRPPDEFRKREFDYTDAHRVVKYLRNKIVRIRWERHEEADRFWFSGYIEGMANDEDTQRFRDVALCQVSEHGKESTQRHSSIHQQRNRTRVGSRKRVRGSESYRIPTL